MSGSTFIDHACVRFGDRFRLMGVGLADAQKPTTSLEFTTQTCGTEGARKFKADYTVSESEKKKVLNKFKSGTPRLVRNNNIAPAGARRGESGTGALDRRVRHSRASGEEEKEKEEDSGGGEEVDGDDEENEDEDEQEEEEEEQADEDEEEEESEEGEEAEEEEENTAGRKRQRAEEVTAPVRRTSSSGRAITPRVIEDLAPRPWK